MILTPAAQQDKQADAAEEGGAWFGDDCAIERHIIDPVDETVKIGAIRKSKLECDRFKTLKRRPTQIK